MAAGHEFAQRGVEFIIFEASGSVGGRIQKFNFGGLTLENGANWIVGIAGNPVGDLAKKYGSSRITGECCTDLQKEVVSIPVAVGHPLDHFDLVIDPFQGACVKRMRGVRDLKEATKTFLQTPTITPKRLCPDWLYWRFDVSHEDTKDKRAARAATVS